jgi:hypothetical protein
MRNISGNPVMMHVPATIGEVTARKNQSDLIYKHMAVLQTIDNIHKRLLGKIIEMDIRKELPSAEFAHLLEFKKEE